MHETGVTNAETYHNNLFLLDGPEGRLPHLYCWYHISKLVGLSVHSSCHEQYIVWQR